MYTVVYHLLKFCFTVKSRVLPLAALVLVLEMHSLVVPPHAKVKALTFELMKFSRPASELVYIAHLVPYPTYDSVTASQRRSFPVGSIFLATRETWPFARP